MRKPELSPRILNMIQKKTKGKISKQAIRSALSRLRNKYSFLTLNAAAQLYARQHGFSVSKLLKDKDRDALRNVEIPPIKIQITKSSKEKRVVTLAAYKTDNRLLKAHIEEINKAYTYGCYTATFVLCRKVLENLIIHHIIRMKYSSNSRQDRLLYYDFGRNRYIDFELLLKNLRRKAADFGPEKKLVERICQLAGEFKDNANDMTHSLYHVASKKEIDNRNFPQILDLIQRLENAI